MAQRDSNVFLYLFIIVLFLFTIMTTLYFLSDAENADLAIQVDDARDETRDIESDHRRVVQELQELRTLLAGPEYEESWPGDEFFRQNVLKSQIEVRVNGALAHIGRPQKEYKYLLEPYGDLQSLFLQYQQSLDEARAARQQADEARVEQSKTNSGATEKLQAEVASLLSRISDLEASIEDANASSQEREEGFLQQIEELTSDYSDQIVTLRRELNFTKIDRDNIEIRLNSCQEESRRETTLEDVDPDGEVVRVLSQQGIAWINLGRRSHMRKKLRFTVFQGGQGGRRAYKGLIEVQRVHEDYSEVRILEQTSELNPITGGDSIASPFYNPDRSPVFVIAGTQLTTPGLSVDYLRTKIGSFGGVLQAAVDLDTDFLVLTENYKGSAEYRTGRDLGVTMIRERDLLQFIGL